MGWGKQHLTPSAIAVCVLCLTLSWAAWDMDRAVHREIAVQNAQESQFAQQLATRADAVGVQAKTVIGGMNALVKSASDAVQAQSKSLAKLQAKAEAVLDHVNRNCGTKVNGELLPCGTLADVGETLKTYRQT